MFESSSRYAPIETAIYEAPDGRHLIYKRRRFLPRGETLPLLFQVTVDVTDRLDQITARALGNAEAFWQVCDANNAMNPFDLTSEAGRAVRIPLPQFPEMP